MVTARCKLCGWEAKASGHRFAALATEAHYLNTGHVVKIKDLTGNGRMVPCPERFGFSEQR